MKITLGKIPVNVTTECPSIGDVFRAKGGARGITRFFAIISITGNVAHAIGLDQEGEIVSTTSYGTHVFAGRERVGVIPELAEMNLAIQWDAL